MRVAGVDAEVPEAALVGSPLCNLEDLRTEIQRGDTAPFTNTQRQSYRGLASAAGQIEQLHPRARLHNRNQGIRNCLAHRGRFRFPFNDAENADVDNLTATGW